MRLDFNKEQQLLHIVLILCEGSGMLCWLVCPTVHEANADAIQHNCPDHLGLWLNQVYVWMKKAAIHIGVRPGGGHGDMNPFGTR